jgi:antibiotic biosynthesis monooxygenase (ABM) superfamily enzyme
MPFVYVALSKVISCFVSPDCCNSCLSAAQHLINTTMVHMLAYLAAPVIRRIKAFFVWQNTQQWYAAYVG